VEVQFLVQDPSSLVWHVGCEVTHLKFERIAEHVSIDGDDGNAPRVWDQLGFRMLDGGSFVRKSDESGASDRLFPVGDPVFEVMSDDDDDDGEMADFIVPDAECEPFTQAVEDNDFVREMHAGVRWFDKWVPKDDRESSVRMGIQRLEARAAHVDDEIRFGRGMGALSYNCPNA